MVWGRIPPLAFPRGGGHYPITKSSGAPMKSSDKLLGMEANGVGPFPCECRRRMFQSQSNIRQFQESCAASRAYVALIIPRSITLGPFHVGVRIDPHLFGEIGGRTGFRLAGPLCHVTIFPPMTSSGNAKMRRRNLVCRTRACSKNTPQNQKYFSK